MAVYKLDAHTIRVLSVEAHRDPRTVVAVIEGRVSALAAASVRAAAKRLGIDLLGSEAVA